MVERDCPGGDNAFQHAMQVAAMNIDIGTTVPRFTRCVEQDLIHRLTRIPGAADVGIRLDAGFNQALFDAETAENLHHIGAEDDPCPDPREGWRLFIDRHRETRTLKETGSA